MKKLITISILIFTIAIPSLATTRMVQQKSERAAFLTELGKKNRACLVRVTVDTWAYKSVEVICGKDKLVINGEKDTEIDNLTTEILSQFLENGFNISGTSADLKNILVTKTLQ